MDTVEITDTKSLSDYSDDDIIDEYHRRVGERFKSTPKLEMVNTHLKETYPNLKYISVVERPSLFKLNCDFVMYGPKMSYGFNIPNKSITRIPNLDIHYTLEKAAANIVKATLKAGIENYMAMDEKYSQRAFLVTSEIPEGKIMLHPETFIEMREHIDPTNHYWWDLLAL